MNWLIIAVLVLVAIFFFKYKEIRHKIGLAAVIIFILFLVVTFGQLYFRNNLDLTTFDGITHAGNIYFTWLGGALTNVFRVGGYAINQDWDVNISSIKESINKTKVK